jgi:hypothetical protein
MLKNQTIKIPISYRNITHYRKLGYNPILNENIEIKTIDLPSSSHVKVDVICALCNKPSFISYGKYIENINRHNFYSCKSCSRHKFYLTCMETYGVDNTSKLENVKDKRKKTFIERYGYETNLIHPVYKHRIKETLKELYGTENWYEIRNTKKQKFKISDELNSLKEKEITKSESNYDLSHINNDYILYRNEVRRITDKHTKILYEQWDGTDYYDNEYIKENSNLHFNDPNYPTIDHKLSVYYGFVNNIDPEIIGDISNLCITKRYINSTKNKLIETEFKLF